MLLVIVVARRTVRRILSGFLEVFLATLLLAILMSSASAADRSAVNGFYAESCEIPSRTIWIHDDVIFNYYYPRSQQALRNPQARMSIGSIPVDVELEIHDLEGNGTRLEYEMDPPPQSQREEGMIFHFSLSFVVAQPEAALESDLLACSNAPSFLSWRYGEGLAMLALLADVQKSCSSVDDSACLSMILNELDVSEDGSINRAELSRAIGGLAFLSAVTSNAALGVSESTVFATMVAGAVLAPVLANALIEGRDFDGDGALSEWEILVDHESGGIAAMLGAGRVAGMVIVGDMVRGMLGSLSSGILGSLF